MNKPVEFDFGIIQTQQVNRRVSFYINKIISIN